MGLPTPFLLSEGVLLIFHFCKLRDKVINMSKIGQILNGMIKIAGIFLFAMVIVIYAGLTCKSFDSTMYASTEYMRFYNWSVSIPDSILKNILYCMAGFAVLFLFYRLDKKYPKKAVTVEKLIFICFLAGYLCAGMAYALTSPYYPKGDQLNTTAGAMYFLQGNYTMFDPLGYIGICPHQKGLLFLYEICFRLFGEMNYTPIRIITVFMNAITIYLGYRLIKELGGSEFSGVLYTVLMFFFVPYFALIPYAYGDLPSIFGIMVLMRFFTAYYYRGGIINILMSVAGALFAVLNRSAAWIAIFALIITAVFLSIKKNKMYPLACALFIAIVSYLALTAVNIRYEKITGYDRHTGSPVTAYIAMGMQYSEGAPGVYNRYHQIVYEMYNGDRALASAEAKMYIRARLAEFKADPEMGYNFYKEKILFQWNDPFFEWNTHMHSFETHIEPTGFYDSVYKGKIHDYLFRFMNRYQAFIYLLCLIAAVRGLVMILKDDKGNFFSWFFHIYFVGGFLFSLIWEAKARYSLPYFVFLILVASMVFSRNKEKVY